jgi:hypothetical protein
VVRRVDAGRRPVRYHGVTQCRDRVVVLGPDTAKGSGGTVPPGGVLVRLEEPFARPVFDLPGRYGDGAIGCILDAGW